IVLARSFGPLLGGILIRSARVGGILLALFVLLQGVFEALLQSWITGLFFQVLQLVRCFVAGFLIAVVGGFLEVFGLLCGFFHRLANLRIVGLLDQIFEATNRVLAGFGVFAF